MLTTKQSLRTSFTQYTLLLEVLAKIVNLANFKGNGW